MVKFEYQGKVYAPSNLEKKLKKLGITKEDIIIIEESDSKNVEVLKLMTNTDKDPDYIKYYCFWDVHSKGWYDSKDRFLSDWPFNKDQLKYIGETLEGESINDSHKRLFALTHEL